MEHIDVEELDRTWKNSVHHFNCVIDNEKWEIHFDYDEKTISLGKKHKGSLTNLRKAQENEVLVASDIKHFVAKRGEVSVVIKWTRKSVERVQTLYFSKKLSLQKFIDILNTVTSSSHELNTIGEQIGIKTITWNMGDTHPPQNIRDMIEDKIEFDILVLAVQESKFPIPSSNSSAIVTRPHKKRLDYISRLFLLELGTNEWMQLKGAKLWNIQITVFIKIRHLPKISQLEKHNEAVGIAGYGPNKGAVAIKFNFNTTSFCFIGSHLAAHQDKVEDRNRDFFSIISGLKLGQNKFDFDTQFHHVFWMGDLNYRIDLPFNTVIDKIKENDLEYLKNHDQLLIQRSKNAAFEGYNEAAITFKPTYRYIRGTDTYNEELNRIPSWCDRILWKSLPNCERFIKNTKYEALDSIQSSDHHPVAALFKVMTLKWNIVHHREKKLCISISNLRGNDLLSKDKNGFSDPFVTFSGFFLRFPAKTSVKKKTLNPSWTDEEIPLLYPTVTNFYLKYCYIYVLLLDEDLVGADNMGQGVIPLYDVFDSPEPVDFICKLTLSGEPAGTLTGKIQLKSVTEKPPKVKQSNIELQSFP